MSSLIPAWTQLIRNLLCVIKSLLLLYYPHSWIITACVLPYIMSTFNNGSNNVTSLFIYGHPLHLITIIEFLICITQLLATFFCISDGFHSMKRFIVEYTIHKKLLADLQQYHWSSNVTFRITGILKQYYRDQMNNSIIKGITSLCLLVIGMSFVVLACNNLHIYGAHHPKLVIEALIMMEVALLFFLYLMLKSLLTHYFRLKRVYKLKHSIQVNMNAESETLSNLLVLAMDLNNANQLLEVLDIASREDICRKLSSNLSDCIDQRVTTHIERDIVVLQSLFESNKQFTSNENNVLLLNSSSIEKSPRKRTSKITKAIKADTAILATTTTAAATVVTSNTVMYLKNDLQFSIEEYIMLDIKAIVFDIIYFVINFIAGYGYMMGILSYYFPSNNNSVFIISDTTTTIGKIVNALMLNLSSENADWYGNFAGDLAWTIEPFVVIFISPLIHYYFDNYVQIKKTKQE